MKKPESIWTFVELQQNEVRTPEVVDCINIFVCCIHWKPNFTCQQIQITIIPTELCPWMCQPATWKMKGIDPSHLLPCASVLYQKIKWINLVAAMWKKCRWGQDKFYGSWKTWLDKKTGWKLVDIWGVVCRSAPADFWEWWSRLVCW